MHLYMLTRGQKDKVDAFIRDLQAQYFTFTPAPSTGNPKGYLQLGIRPIELWEIAFPKEHLNEVLATIGGAKIETEDKRWGIKILAYILKLKGLLGLKDVPDVPADTLKRITSVMGNSASDGAVDRKLIGIKDDTEIIEKYELV